MKTRYIILAGLAIATMSMMGSCSKKAGGNASQVDSTKVDTVKVDTAKVDTVAKVDSVAPVETKADKVTKQFSAAIDAVANNGAGKCQYFLFDITGDSVPDLFVRKTAASVEKLTAYSYNPKGIVTLCNLDVTGKELFCDGTSMKSASYVNNNAEKGNWSYSAGKVVYTKEMSINGVGQAIYDKMKPANMPVVEWATSSDKESLQYFIKETVK